MASTVPKDVDTLIIGGGFYGTALLLFLSSVTRSLTLVEAADQIMTRASATNQARVHTGFHYPRSVLTAVRSRLLSHRFLEEFPDAIDDSFQMLYAIARHRSKITARRFWQIFSNMEAPIRPASATDAALFAPDMVDGIFACTEYAFDYKKLSDQLINKVDGLGLDLRLSTSVTSLQERDDHVLVELSDGTELRAKTVFNITYAQINAVLQSADLPLAPLKHELTEIALMVPPEELAERAVTVMDGPFFSSMPYPAETCHSLTHVRYTPHESWIDHETRRSPYDILSHHQPDSRARQMIIDASRYVPCFKDAQYIRSRFEIKTVLTSNEQDDGRPILYQRRPANSRVISVLGGKVDNIYDLFALVRNTNPEWTRADERYITTSSSSGRNQVASVQLQGRLN